MKKFWLILKYVFFLAIGISLVWWQFHKLTAAQRFSFFESLKQANYWLIVPVIVMSILSHISRAMRWKILIEPLGYKPSTSNTFYAVMSGYVANTFLPRAGEVLRCSLLNRYEHIPMNKLLGTILIERGFDLICYVMVVIITIILQISLVSEFVKEELSVINKGNALQLIIPVAIIALLVMGVISLTRSILKKFAHITIIKSIGGFITGLWHGFRTIIVLKNRRGFIAHTTFIWLMYLLQIYIGFSALSATSHLGIIEAASVLSFATLGMIVSPGGIGAFPLAVQQVLLIYNVDNISFGWLIWGMSTAIIIIAGIISFMILVYKNRNQNEVEPTPVIQDI